MASDWASVKKYVKSEFKDYLPVPAIADIERYRPLNFLNLTNGVSFASKWYEKPLALLGETLPSFDSVGEIENFAAAHPLEDGSITPLPEIQVEKLCICGEDAKTKMTLEGQIATNPPENTEGSIKSSTVLPCLGVVSRQRVKYRDLRAWIQQYCFLDKDMMLEAKRGNLFIIHDAITAEKLSAKGKTKQSLSGKISSVLKFYYKSRNYSDLRRPPEFGHFPISFKIGRIKVPRLKHAAHASVMTDPTNGSSPSSSTATGMHRLKIEPLRDFIQPHSRRKFGKENNSPSSDDSLSPPSSKVARRTEEDGSASSEPRARRCLSKMLAKK